jgi:hypothetical protein
MAEGARGNTIRVVRLRVVTAPPISRGAVVLHKPKLAFIARPEDAPPKNAFPTRVGIERRSIGLTAVFEKWTTAAMTPLCAVLVHTMT